VEFLCFNEAGAIQLCKSDMQIVGNWPMAMLSEDSAQRLSASKINSGQRRNGQSINRRCSTPFGIKDQLRAAQEWAIH